MMSEKDSISIKLVELDIPVTPQLPPHYHTTNGLPPDLMTPLKEALDAARPAFSSLLKTLNPDILLYDFIQPWAPEEAYSLNIPAVLFFTIGAAVTSFITHQWFDPETKYPFPAIYFRENECKNYIRLVKQERSRVINCLKRSCDIVLIKTFRELEGKYIDYLWNLSGKKFVQVGPLVQVGPCATDQNEENDHEIMEWLHGKDIRSTVFASFGTEYFLSEDEIEEIALGLELSNVNFIWVLRFPSAGDKEKTIDQLLPQGFLERVKGRGKVVEGWAPQQKILSHKSVGGFLSHCGWSSIMEGIYFGVPIIAVPMHLDQPFNARLVEEVGFGEEVVRNRDGKLERAEVARVVEKAVVDEMMRRRVEELSEEMRGKGEEEEIDVVVEELVKLCRREEKWMSDLMFMNEERLFVE
ncbi:hypothetical protein ACJIZ3_022771 [Penstemon smallii]|uniref:Glycosyltransferase n=1 Tax=Penstemon smallii TaxID=265156 RepID=A0ABD3TPE9_9LAMI